MTLSIGNVVRLKSGGPTMTVVLIEDEDRASVSWFDTTTNGYRDAHFPIASLEVVT